MEVTWAPKSGRPQQTGLQSRLGQVVLLREDRIYFGRAGAKAGSFKVLFRDNPSFGPIYPNAYSFPVTELNLHDLKLTVLPLSLI